MKFRSVENMIFAGMLLILVYQYALLYLSVIDGSWVNFLIVSLVFILGLFLGRTTYIILGSVLSFVSMSAGVLMLMIPYTRAMYFWAAIALLTITPLMTYLMYLLDHQLLKRKALIQEFKQIQKEKPDVDVITGALNKHALDKDIAQELKLVYYHDKDYRFTLTMVKIDFLENVINFLGNQRFNHLLKATSDHLNNMLFTVDHLYYIGTGRFVILSPMLGVDNAPIMKRKIKSHIDDIAEKFGLARDALVLRMGQVSYSTQDKVQNSSVEDTLAQLERSAETDIVKEYM
ncbi:diguanylate cyclase domain-containing protein [Companilactobacillus futsaii]|uniref:GGDEF domain-containing protein n=2 Tax=Companilactobacillus futsaii TaxID=938155 RepID=A0A5B7SZ94_9LACO|nr:diguanylate cyclase [Companilactobacillus futsaii]QCX23690.1 GGDEF domain-containing protein [Companilactobacillus futsaii]